MYGTFDHLYGDIFQKSLHACNGGCSRLLLVLGLVKVWGEGQASAWACECIMAAQMLRLAFGSPARLVGQTGGTSFPLCLSRTWFKDKGRPQFHQAPEGVAGTHLRECEEYKAG